MFACLLGGMLACSLACLRARTRACLIACWLARYGEHGWGHAPVGVAGLGEGALGGGYAGRAPSVVVALYVMPLLQLAVAVSGGASGCNVEGCASGRWLVADGWWWAAGDGKWVVAGWLRWVRVVLA